MMQVLLIATRSRVFIYDRLFNRNISLLLEADPDVCLSLINALAPEYQSVASALKNVVNSYQFGKLMTLIPDRMAGSQ